MPGFAIRKACKMLEEIRKIHELRNSIPFSEKTAKLVEQVLDKKGEKLITKSVRHTNKKYPILSDDFAFDNMSKQDIDLIVSSLSCGVLKTE